MYPRIYILLTCFTLLMNPLWAQRKLNFSNVSSGSLKTGGTIMRDNQIKGHFLLSQDDRISEERNVYTIHVMDENLNKVRAIRFEGSATISISEAACDDSTVAFLLSDYTLKRKELRIYDNEGTLKSTYSRSYTSKRRPVYIASEKSHKNIDENGGLYNVGKHGYMVIYHVRTARRTDSYELNYYDHQDKKKNWKYLSPGQLRYQQKAEFMAKTDSLFFLETTKIRTSRRFSTKVTAFNIHSKKKAFEIDGAKDSYQFAPISVIPQEKDTILIVGSYYANGTKIMKRASKGVAIFRINSRGAILSKSYNAWGKEMARYLDVDDKGRLNSDNSYVFLHDAIKGPNGKLFVVGEGYKKTIYPVGVVFSTILLPLTRMLIYTRMKATDIVLMEFNSKDQLSRSSIYDKRDNVLGVGTDYINKHTAAHWFKETGTFDYRFTTGVGDNQHFAICYYDKRKSSRKEFGYFNILRYNGQKFRQQEILMNSAEGNISVYPSKPGFLMVIESIKKERKTEVRLEKII